MIFSPLQCVDDDRQGEEQMQQVHDEHGEAAHQFDLNMQVDWQYDSGIQY